MTSRTKGGKAAAPARTRMPSPSFHQYRIVEAVHQNLHKVFHDAWSLRSLLPTRRSRDVSPADTVPQACADTLNGAAFDDTDVVFNFEGLDCHATCSPNSHVVDRFSTAFSEYFVLPNEIESLEGFQDCLKLNRPFPISQHPSARERAIEAAQIFARPHREYILLLEDPETKIVLGGLNFIVFPVTQDLRQRFGAQGVVLPDTMLGHIHVNFVYVAPVVRGIGQRLLPLILGVAQHFCTAQGVSGGTDMFLFFEQNDPFKMPIKDYVMDNAFAGVDQIDRLLIWAGFGGQFIDFEYLQPPLDETSNADDTDRTLALGFGVASMTPGATAGSGQTPPARVATGILIAHLARFFAISVGKGRMPPPLHAAQRIANPVSYDDYFHNACQACFQSAAAQGETVGLLRLPGEPSATGRPTVSKRAELKAIRRGLHTMFELMPTMELTEAVTADGDPVTVGDVLREGDGDHRGRYDSLCAFLRSDRRKISGLKPSKSR